MPEHELIDGDRRIQFIGVELGRATSDDGDALRWTEVAIYRTESGTYLTTKIGRSVVFHRVDGPCTRGAETAISEAMRDPRHAELVGCPLCWPDADVALTDLGESGIIRLERDIHSTHIADTASGAIATLYRRDENGTRYLIKVARDALATAIQQDVDLRTAAQVEYVN